MGKLAWTARGDRHFLDAHVADAALDVSAVDAVSVADQETRRLLVGKRLDDLLGRPGSTKERYLARVIESLCFSTHEMAFVSGPRQCGKTTLAKMLLRKRKEGAYYNWDEIEFRRAWGKRPSSIPPQAGGGAVPLVVLDEIHKDRRWTRNLRRVFDTLATACDTLVTGSARLSVYTKGGDSPCSVGVPDSACTPSRSTPRRPRWRGGTGFGPVGR